MMETPNISVVTPVFNTADYLEECIQSVLRQTYPAFEYVICDNQSTDDSLAIARKYAAQDSRIRIEVGDAHVGQVENYNRALRSIHPATRFVKVVQADDFLYPECLEEMLAVAELDEQVRIVSSLQLASDHVKGSGIPCRSLDGLKDIMKGRDVCRLFLLHNTYVFGTPTSVLYRADDIRARPDFYPTTSYFEDSEICFELLKEGLFGFVHKVLTFTRTDNDSLSTRVLHLKPNSLHRHIIMRKFGKFYLDDLEFRSLLDECERTTRRNLVLAVGKPHAKAVFDYYRTGFQQAGLEFPAPDPVRGQLGRLFRLAGNPLNTLSSIFDSIRRRK